MTDLINKINKTDKQWMELAEGELGISEYLGAADNPRIVEYHITTTLDEHSAANDETPWCSSFVNWCLTRSGIAGTNNASAKSWINWKGGQVIRERADIQYGDILIFERPSGGAGAGHVGFFIRWSVNNNPLSDPIILGGNQGDKVSKAVIKMELVAARRPLGRKPLIKSRTVNTAVAATATTTVIAGPTIVDTINNVASITTAGKPLVDILTTQNVTVGVVILLLISILAMLYFYLDRRNKNI